MPREKQIFKDFSEFWHYTRSLSEKQREKIFDSMSSIERKRLKKSFQIGGWEDVFFRDILDRFANEVREQHNFDILQSRCKVLAGKTVYVKKETWDHILSYTKNFNSRHVYYLIGGMRSEQCDSSMIFLVKGEKI